MRERGIANDQNMEPEMMPILNEKLEEFPDKDKYQKKEYDMQYLTSIEKKAKKGVELTKEDLRFLYEIDNKIDGFGHKKDPRIMEIRNMRNKYKDLSVIFDCTKEEISDDIKDVLNGKQIVYFDGNLYLDRLISTDVSVLILKKSLELPQKVGGDLVLDSLTSAEGLKLPENYNQNLLWTSKDIKQSIMDSPDKYYRYSEKSEGIKTR